MENENFHKIDSLAIQEAQDLRVMEALEGVISKCELKPLEFLSENFNNKKIRLRVTEPDIKQFLGSVLIKVASLAGIKSEIDQFSAKDLVWMLTGTYDDLTVEEIYKAFELERYGVYETKTEHFNLFDANYVSAIIKKYRAWKQTMKHNHNITSNNNLALSKNTESGNKELEDKIMIEGIVRRFEEFKVSGIIELPIVHCADWLYENGFIKNDDGFMLGSLETAISQLKREQAVKTSASKSERNQIKEETARIFNGTSTAIVVRQKLIILTEFFQHHSLNDTDMLKFLTER